MSATEDRLLPLLDGTPDRIFDMAGGFDFVDEIAVRLDAHWRGKTGAVIIGRMELCWLLDGYARSRLGHGADEP